MLSSTGESGITHVSGISQKISTTLWPGVELLEAFRVSVSGKVMEAIMGFGKGALLWLIGIPLPIILLLAIFMHH